MAKQNEKPFKNVEPVVWKPQEDGQNISITGALIAKKEDVGNNNSKAYILENKEGLYHVWGSTVLDERMALTNVGDVVRITFIGIEENKKKQPVKIYKVEVQEK